jgi:thiazole synthase ThiGH ThiG subunit
MRASRRTTADDSVVAIGNVHRHGGTKVVMPMVMMVGTGLGLKGRKNKQQRKTKYGSQHRGDSMSS